MVSDIAHAPVDRPPERPVDLPADRTVVDGVDVLGSLSPSRAGDFMSCPLLFRYRTIDRLPESSSPDAVRGTLVHQVLEDIFDLPAPERTPAAAHELLRPTWAALQERSDQARQVRTTLDEASWLDSAHQLDLGGRRQPC